MSRFRSRRSKRIKSDINVIPYIDVLLVLLVIFMVTAPLLPPSTIDLPSVGAQKATQQTPIEVQINAQGEFFIRNLSVPNAKLIATSPSELISTILSQQGTLDALPVVIVADKKVPYELVIQTLDRLRAGGVQKVGLLAQSQP